MPTTYRSPGVYVEEKLSGIAPITGVGTSTAGFIGVISTSVTTPTAISRVETITVNIKNSTGAGAKKFALPRPEQLASGDRLESVTGDDAATFSVQNANASASTNRTSFSLTLEDGQPFVTFATDVAADATITGSYKLQVVTTTAASTASTYTLAKAIPSDPNVQSVAAGTVELCTNFGEFKKSFGDFSNLPGQNRLAHAVFGFFRNGGTRCFVVWVADESRIQTALDQFEALDEIAIVAAPGVTSKAQLTAIDAHCKALGDRFAIFDGPANVTDLNLLKPGIGEMPGSSDYAALYFPWIKVYDPVSKAEIPVPPSGHIAGLYARVDAQRGVFKAPANEVLLGAVGLTYSISKAKQEPLNDDGINCIRNLNGNIRVWGARTLGGNQNGEFKYISIRRLFNYLRESIDEGTQWTVFEPNTPELWAKIRRNLTAFLLVQWRSGALFGTTPEEAFYVKCDEETNPPEIRDIGQVVTEIGVAVVKPAEFVIFRVSQWGGPDAG